MREIPDGYLWNTTAKPLVICLTCGALVAIEYTFLHDMTHIKNGD